MHGWYRRGVMYNLDGRIGGETMGCGCTVAALETCGVESPKTNLGFVQWLGLVGQNGIHTDTKQCLALALR